MKTRFMKNASFTKKLYYAAGLLEGEGSFSSHRQQGASRPVVSCGMMDYEPLDMIAGMFHGRVMGPYKRKNPNHAALFTIQFYGTKAIGIMLTLFSLLSPRRRRQIKKALKTSTMKHGHRHKKYCDKSCVFWPR